MPAVVVGGGVAGLVAALGLLRQGRDVLLLEASDRLGGRVAPVEVDGIVLDSGAESFAVRGGAVRALLDDLGLGGDVVEPVGSAWLALAGETVPFPAGGVLGIPGAPLAPDVVRVLGTRAAVRAHADRLLPLLKVGRYEALGPLVRRRMGGAVLERLVDPVVRSVYGADPEAVPIDAVAPGLNAALTAAGSLSGAVLRLRSAAPPGAAAQGLAGGVHRLPGALAATLRRRGAEVRTLAPVHAVEPRGTGWAVRTGLQKEAIEADRVVLALDGAAALDLLGTAVPSLAGLPRPEPAVSRTVLLVVDDPRLDAAPRGTGVLRAAERTDVVATALTHVTAKWPWLADGLPASRHVLRLSYRGAGEVDDERARADAAALLGVGVPAPRARRDVVWTDAAPALDPAVLAARRRLGPTSPAPGLGVTGSWIAGTGLASVVAHADRVVRALSA